jgi:hypothetical protein
LFFHLLRFSNPPRIFASRDSFDPSFRSASAAAGGLSDSPETSQSATSRCGLSFELGRCLSEKLDLLLAVSSLVKHLDFLLQHQDPLLARVALQVFGNLPTADLNPGVTEFCELPWVAFTGNDGAMLIGGHETLCRLSALACSIESRDTQVKGESSRQVSGTSDTQLTFIGHWHRDQ